jgi:hypothetical protein
MTMMEPYMLEGDAMRLDLLLSWANCLPEALVKD